MITITVMKDGKEISLSDISEETLLGLRKETEILVPNSIKIVKFGQKDFGIRNEFDQTLTYHKFSWCVSNDTEGTIKCKLTPCNRGDLKPGDLAYRSKFDYPDFERLNAYCIIIDYNKYANWSATVSDSVLTNRCNWKHWYKVEEL